MLVTAQLRARTSAGLAREPRPGLFGGDRRTREAGILLVAVPSVIAGVARQDAMTWLVLVIAAVVVLILATSPDGIFRSASPRRHLVWAAVALSTAGLWWRLGDSRIMNLEPYVLPLSGVLLLIALLVWRATRSAQVEIPDQVAPVITLAALLVAILPLGATGATGPIERAIVVGAASAILAITGSFARGTPRSRPYLDSATLAGTLGVLTIIVGRTAAVLADPGPPDTRLDAWLAVGLTVLFAVAFGQARERADQSAAPRATLSLAIGVVGIAVVLGGELAAIDGTALGSIRAFALILLFSTLHVIAFLVDSAPLTKLFGWVAIAAAGLVGIGGIVTGALSPIEVGTVPVAGALLVTGALTLLRVPTSRTWAWLAPGVALLLIPSLIATAEHPEIWRLVGLGCVGIAIIVASATLRLQAPFLIAVIVVLIHATATFAPQIRATYESVEWWLWFVPLGIGVVVFAARFEKSVLRMRSVAMRIRALR